ncbi:class I adenylate-forming enzyme family protein [Actinopolyspora mortivallis]|uniref:AMP-dependent synthetase n=1 Tax=Actinopolyspora mortivallis TaxID=33906 RepID=A0A2T0GUT5_ACTMO|nr:AMP-binding protein [Actinopolyspora mortivallis]PRW62872.1 hypothetical protein CEP50_13055 [Actinopolyspora mortivallis]
MSTTSRPRVPPVLAGGLPRSLHDGTRLLDGAELLSHAHSAAAELAAAGVGPGSRVAVEADTEPVTRLARMLGADLLGAATLLVDPDWSTTERAGTLADAAPHVVVGGRIRPGHPPPTLPEADGSSLFYLPTTSGSTSRPRVLARTRSSWWHSFEAFEVGVTGRDTVLVPGPVGSSLFLFGALHAMHLGAGLRLLPRWSAHAAARACREATVVHVVPSMLSALLAVLARHPQLREDCRVRRFVCGGAAVDDGLRAELERTLPGSELVEYYGSAEHSLVALRGSDGVLHPARAVETDIRDGEGSVPPGETGTLWVRSPLACSGHLEAGRLVPLPEGFHTVGDLAVPRDGGGFTVLGRGSGTIDSGAELVPAESVEHVLRPVPGVRDVVVAATPHPRFGSLVTAVIETDPTHPPEAAELRRVARRELNGNRRPRRWLTTGALPRTSTGKPARGLITERLAAGTLAAEPLR